MIDSIALTISDIRLTGLKFEATNLSPFLKIVFQSGGRSPHSNDCFNDPTQVLKSLAEILSGPGDLLIISLCNLLTSPSRVKSMSWINLRLGEVDDVDHPRGDSTVKTVEQVSANIYLLHY